MMRYLLVVFLLLSPAVHAQQKSQMLEVLQQLTRLEAEVRQLRGEVERLTYENRRLKTQQNDLYTDLDQRIRSLQTGAPASMQQPQTSASLPGSQLAIEPVAAASRGSTGSAPVPPVSSTGRNMTGMPTASVQQPGYPPTAATASVDPAKEQADYKNAFNLLKVGKYDEAIKAYTKFLQQYPAGDYAANAQYWLGEANYVRRQFPMAIAEFQKVVANYPNSKKLPDALLKIGYIHYEMKQTDEAQRVLTDLARQFPGTTPARLAENRLQRMKLEGR